VEIFSPPSSKGFSYQCWVLLNSAGAIGGYFKENAAGISPRDLVLARQCPGSPDNRNVTAFLCAFAKFRKKNYTNYVMLVFLSVWRYTFLPSSRYKILYNESGAYRILWGSCSPYI
jgi:hypothetical protein